MKEKNSNKPAKKELEKEIPFEPMNSEDLLKVLGLTIKKDEQNKLATFLCCLSAYTDESQFNISFNAPSSTGKSYIPIEIAQYFPPEDVIELAHCSPTAFFHEQGKYSKEKNAIFVDLSRKIIIFLDQQNNALLARLRPLLSHDKKEIVSKITDKNQKGSNKTKTAIIKGFPSVIFCSAGLSLDEQEGTRFLLLSPETSQDKIREAVLEKIQKESDRRKYFEMMNQNPDRQKLISRIKAIKEANISDINIANVERITEVYFKDKKLLKPRHSRDVGRLIALTRCFALLNFWYRERHEDTIIANSDDFNEAFKIWEKLSVSQEYNLPPYIYELYQKSIIVAYKEKNDCLPGGQKIGISRKEIQQKNFQISERPIPEWQLRAQIVPMLETAGLIIQEPDENDRRKMLITPTCFIEDKEAPVLAQTEEREEKLEPELAITQEDIPF